MPKPLSAPCWFAPVQYETALAHLDRDLELNPREISAYVNPGEVYRQWGGRRQRKRT